jgi:hypothetical protein
MAAAPPPAPFTAPPPAGHTVKGVTPSLKKVTEKEAAWPPAPPLGPPPPPPPPVTVAVRLQPGAGATYLPAARVPVVLSTMGGGAEAEMGDLLGVGGALGDTLGVGGALGVLLGVGGALGVLLAEGERDGHMTVSTTLPAAPAEDPLPPPT